MTFRPIAVVICVIVALAIVSIHAYALIAFLEIGLKISTLPVVSLGIGIGVDYGIYIYGRSKDHLDAGESFAVAYKKTLVTVGAGIVLTGITLATSVATWLPASLKLPADMGAIWFLCFSST